MDTCFISLHSQCNWHWLWAKAGKTQCLSGAVGSQSSCNQSTSFVSMADLNVLPGACSPSSPTLCARNTSGAGDLPLECSRGGWGSCAGRVWLVPHSEYAADVSGAVPVSAGGSSLCSQKSHSAQKVLCSKPGVRASFFKLECVQIKQPWNKMQL